MTLKTLRQIMKALADDTRLRILNLLIHKELTVKEMCTTLGISQPRVSKHLARMRLLKIVNDVREKNFITYSLHPTSEQGKMVAIILKRMPIIETFQKDRASLKRKNS